MNDFSQLGLAAPLLRALSDKGYTTPTPIQAQAIPIILGGHDVLGIAATGTGKTAAFALPILQKLSTGEREHPKSRKCRALILCPTRELAQQITDNFRRYAAQGKLRATALYGGVSFGKQLNEMSGGVDVLIATPGRLMDHMQRGTVDLQSVGVLVLDEADHMLDLGFIPAVRRIVRALPRKRQTLMFSATMPPDIRALAADLLTSPQTVSVALQGTAPKKITQSVVHGDPAAKRAHLTSLLQTRAGARTLIFTRTKRGADKVAKDLSISKIPSAAIHGNKSQNQRVRTLDAFRSGRTPVLVATDIAARGIDIGGIDIVVNYDLPNVPETYVHRIGRTGRAGASGEAIAYCAADERGLLKAIERLLGGPIPSTNTPTAAAKAHHPAPANDREPSRGAPSHKRPQPQRHRQNTDKARDRRPQAAGARTGR